MPLVDDGHAVWIHCFWISNQFQRIYLWFPKAYTKFDNTAQLNVMQTLFDIFNKNVNQTCCFEATEFKFFENDIWTLRQHIRVSTMFLQCPKQRW